MHPTKVSSGYYYSSKQQSMNYCRKLKFESYSDSIRIFEYIHFKLNFKPKFTGISIIFLNHIFPIMK